MVNSNSTFIWEGKVQLGDEPGIYSNASYAGLSVEFPLTVHNFTKTNPKDDTINLELLTEDVNVFSGYSGHHIIIRQYFPDPQPANQYKWKETIIKDTDQILNGASKTVVNIPVRRSVHAIYLSIAIEIDTNVKPGLYDDFLFTGLRYTTTNNSLYVNFGFIDVN